MANKRNLKAIIYFLEFLLFVGLFGGIISLINHLLRKNGLASTYTTAILAAILIFAYYKAWRWICRKLNLFS